MVFLVVLRLLIFEAAATDKLTQDRRGRYLRRVDWLEVIEEFEQSLCLGILGYGVRHLAQFWLDKLAQYGNLVEERAVEHHIGILLIGEDVLVLASTHARPATNGRFGISATRVVVARDAAN